MQCMHSYLVLKHRTHPLLLVHETPSHHELAFEVVCWIPLSCCLFIPIISWRRSLRLFTSSPFFFFKMYDLSLPLCHAFVKCFIFFKSTGSLPVLKTRKTFHEISFIAPSVKCDPSSGFYKEEIHSDSKQDHQQKIL